MTSSVSAGSEVAPEASEAIPPSQSLRFAVVITGGVSLAVWMGGIARELNLLSQAGAATPPPPPAGTDGVVFDFYQRLCNQFGWTIEIDVLAGTSAGGINAALLGMANACGGDLGKLRKLWLDEGAFETLLRDPAIPSPPSLLQGDGVLLTGIRRAAKDIRDTSRRIDKPAPTLLNVTTTLLKGELSRFTDDYGTTVSDSDHLGLFTFTQDDLVKTSSDAALALAARSSASFPGAFEPAFLPADDTDADEFHPDMSPFISTTVGHFASDGGQLENQPIKPALQAIFDRPDASDPVRRVMLYVVPTAGSGAAAIPDVLKSPPPLAKALIADFQASRSQSITSALKEINTHNDIAVVRQDGWRRLAKLGTSIPMAQFVDDQTFEAYRNGRARDMARPVVNELLTQQLAQRQGAPGHDPSPAVLENLGVVALKRGSSHRLFRQVISPISKSSDSRPWMTSGRYCSNCAAMRTRSSTRRASRPASSCPTRGRSWAGQTAPARRASPLPRTRWRRSSSRLHPPGVPPRTGPLRHAWPGPSTSPATWRARRKQMCGPA